LSLIPPTLASIGLVITIFKQRDYFESLRNGDLDILLSLGIAAIAFVWIFLFILQKTNFVIALLTMFILPPFLFFLYACCAAVFSGLFSSPFGWAYLIYLALSENK